MYKIIITLLIFITSITACEQLPGTVNQAKREVRRNLIDPHSAIFDSVYETADNQTVCGLVNAKNRMAGYIGNTRFMYEVDTDTVTFISNLPTERDFERYFQNLKYSDVEDYIKLESECKNNALWESKCNPTGVTIFNNKYCDLINSGKGLNEVYDAIQPSLLIY